MKIRGFKYMKEPEFTKIKSMLDLDIPVAKIIPLTGRSNWTIYTIKHAVSYADYRRIVHDNMTHLHTDATKQAPVKEPVSNGTHTSTPEYTIAGKDLVQVLKEINDSIRELILIQARKQEQPY